MRSKKLNNLCSKMYEKHKLHFITLFSANDDVDLDKRNYTMF